MEIKKGIKVIVIFHSLVSNAVSIKKEGLSYDDVLLIPQRSVVQSRQQTTTKTYLTPTIALNIPIISANMDTVTESTMAIALAQLGGIGIIHRFNSIEEQVTHVMRVKRHRNAIIKTPLFLDSNATIYDAQVIMKKNDVSSLLVVDDAHKLVGILTARDIRFQPDTTPIAQLMTPRDKLITGDANISIDMAKHLLLQHKLEKLPLLNADGTIAGLVTIKDIYNKIRFPLAAVDNTDRLLVGAALGTKDDAIERAHALVKAGVDVLVIDIAHGHCDQAINIVKKLRDLFPKIGIIAGNVATAQGTRELIKAGADGIKVGIGPGSICTTRITTGCGYPQLSAIIECANEADKYGIPVIADGGIKNSGDITKALAAGASTVMLGRLLAGTDESPGIPFIKNSKKYKIIRGMASFGANMARNEKTSDKNKVADYVPEGVEAVIPYKGSVHEIIEQLLGGLKSGLSYCGVESVAALRGAGNFITITAAGVRESRVHDVDEVVK